MNFDDTPAEAAFRAEVRAWIDANAPHELAPELEASTFANLAITSTDPIRAAKDWQAKKAASGWAVPNWPKAYGGRDASPIERVIWQQEEGLFGRLSGMFGIGLGMCGPTLMTWASEEQKRQHLPAMARGETVWCQLFSEPAGGSDLAGLRTRAERQGDEWIINGQKIWTSGAHYSDWGILVTRSDPEAAKHKGLTFFFLDMKSPGIEIRPIKQITGQSHFNEVYFSDVRVPDAQRLGKPGQGWEVSLTTLMNERLSIGGSMPTGLPEFMELARRLPVEGGTAFDDRAVRERIADWHVRTNGLKFTAFRHISALSRGEIPGPEASMGKLVAGNTMQEIATLALDLQDMHGAIADPELAEMSGRFQYMWLRSCATRIEGGTDEILRNIIAERVLGLPPDIRVDKDVPFNRIPTGLGQA